MLKSILLCASLLFALPVVAGTKAERDANAHKAVASMIVTGYLDISERGEVEGHFVDPKPQLTPALLSFISNTVHRWRFEPIKQDGQAVPARVQMRLRLIAREADSDSYNIQIAASFFGNTDKRLKTDFISIAKTSDIKYPDEVLGMRGKGRVYLIVQVGSDGSVMNVAAEQVNLTVAGTDREMDRMRRLLAESAIRSVKNWRFNPPTTGPSVRRASWLARQAVIFQFKHEKSDETEGWVTYVPGPRNEDIPWAREDLRTAGSPDALPDGGLYALQQGAKLLTPLSP